MWCGALWCGVVYCGMVWCTVVWCGVLWYGVVYCGMVWCTVVWCTVVWCTVVCFCLSGACMYMFVRDQMAQSLQNTLTYLLLEFLWLGFHYLQDPSPSTISYHRQKFSLGT